MGDVREKALEARCPVGLMQKVVSELPPSWSMDLMPPRAGTGNFCSWLILGTLCCMLKGFPSYLVDLGWEVESGRDPTLLPSSPWSSKQQMLPREGSGGHPFPSGCVLVFLGFTPLLSISWQARGPILQGSHRALPELQLAAVCRAQRAPPLPGLADGGGPEQLLHLDGEEAPRPG